MRKSQIISLVILLALVTATIWIGALYDGGTPEIKPTDSPSATGEPVGTETPPAPTVSVTDEEISQLPTDTITWSPGFSDGALNISLESSLLEKMAEYGCIYDGSSFGQEAAYITFDVGYGDEQDVKDLEAALDALQKTNIKAIFFVTDQFFTGSNVEAVVKRMAGEGHLLGNRGKIVEDNNMSLLTVEEYKNALRTVENGYKAIMGQDAVMKYFRPIGGKFSIRDLAIAKQMGYTTVLWTSLYAMESLDGLNGRVTSELQKNSIFSVMSYSIAGDASALEQALLTASSKYAIKQLGQQ